MNFYKICLTQNAGHFPGAFAFLTCNLLCHRCSAVAAAVLLCQFGGGANAAGGGECRKGPRHGVDDCSRLQKVTIFAWNFRLFVSRFGIYLVFRCQGRKSRAILRE